jgi:hypothetical protein
MVEIPFVVANELDLKQILLGGVVQTCEPAETIGLSIVGQQVEVPTCDLHKLSDSPMLAQ